MDQCTDATCLRSELGKVDRQLHELTLSSQTRYAPRQQLSQLRSSLDRRSETRDSLITDVECLMRQEAMLRQAVDAAQAYLKIQLPHQTIGDAVLRALATAVYNQQTRDGIIIIITIIIIIIIT